MARSSDPTKGKDHASQEVYLAPSANWGAPNVIARLDEKWQPRRTRRRWHNERYRLSLVLRKNLRRGQKLVDVGCGTGYYVPDYLATVGAENTYLADGAPNMLKECRSRYPDIPESNLHHANIYDLPFSDGQFDAVVNCDVLMHIPEYKKALRELHRICNPDGGRLFLRVNLIDGETDGVLPDPDHPDPSNIYWIAYGRDEFRRTLEELKPSSVTIVDRICRKSIRRPDKEIIGHAAIVVLTRGRNPYPVRTGTRLTHILRKPLGAWA